jgi:hypothetical protein
MLPKMERIYWEDEDKPWDFGYPENQLVEIYIYIYMHAELKYG